MVRRVFRFLLVGVFGAALALIIAFNFYLNERRDLDVWHLADLDEEFTAQTDISSFEEQLVAEICLILAD